MATEVDPAGRAYHEASVAIRELVETSGWTDLFILLRQTADRQNAEAIISLFENGRLAMTVAAEKQDAR